ncbi:hypothetical protein [Chromobacterium aquaticum]|uniref:Uncharacterized protein n=1 Tax=Chromobacterium aquaticum TaxID=467180 RepID=A0ABV9A1C2_9NEIS|nr:hypothetical protein [Chromobacterium aquaticum]MCD5363531.1 hypothetical protein [Chromobacterium aquaticum]
MSISSANPVGVSSATAQTNYVATDKKPVPQNQVEQALPTALQTTSSTATASTTEATSPKSSPSVVVNISNAGKAALQEATETVAQTKAEAVNGDRQAQRQLAKIEASKK